MNSLFGQLGIASWKPVLTALLLPPVPWLVLLLVGARCLTWRRGLGWLAVLVAVAGLWLSQCAAVGERLETALLAPPGPLGAQRLAELRRDVEARRPVAIVVLGGGRQPLAPEYGLPNLTPQSLERLRYAVWLSRETGAPMAFSGGTGHGQPDGIAEAQIAARIAAREFGRPLQWLEDGSRDTRENAQRTLTLLRPAGLRKIVLVTHGWHMPRALRAFREAASLHGMTAEVVPAPMALSPHLEHAALRWMPSAEGGALVRHVLRETIGRWSGA